MKIAVFSGSRADYGLLRPLLLALKKDDFFKISLVLCASALQKKEELAEIRKDFKSYISLEAFEGGGSRCDILRCMSSCFDALGVFWEKNSFDLIILLGDRYEIFCVAAAAAIMGVPIAHLCGGELSYGAFDDALRHSISKFASLHFCTTKEYAKRIIQLGEHPSTVHALGSTFISSLKNVKILSKKSLEKELNFKLLKQNLLITFHPTSKEKNSLEQLEELLKALDAFSEIGLIFSAANADNEGKLMNERIKAYVKKNAKRAVFYPNLGQKRYFSCLALVDGVVGNSSSALSEAPSFKKGAINIGSRQDGRIKPASVINCAAKKEDIKKALLKLFSPAFQKSLESVVNPYDLGDPLDKMIGLLKRLDLKKLNIKKFYDIAFK